MVSPVYKDHTFADIIREVGDQQPVGAAKTKRRLIVEKAFELALRGVPWAIQWIVERAEGKAPMGLLIGDMRAKDVLRDVPDEVLMRLLDERADDELSTKPKLLGGADSGSA